MAGQTEDLAMTERELMSDVAPLSEAAFRSDGSILVRIIAEGWGSSGYYSKKLLSEAAGMYKRGTKMFINHPSRSELKERPERDLNQLAAYFVEEMATWQDTGLYGPGLYQVAKPLPNYAEFLKEAAPVIGVSHYVLGKTKQGEIAGRSGPIVESIDQVVSVDFVTTPGAKGSIGAIYESWRQEDDHMAETEYKTILTETFNSLREQQRSTESENVALLKENGDLKTEITARDTEIKTLKESLAKEQEKNILTEAGVYAVELLEKADIPELAKERIKATLINAATLKEGKLDTDALKTLAESEIIYAKSLTGSTGTVRGFGSTGSGSTVTLEEANKALIESYIASGMQKETAEAIVRGL